MSATFSDLSDGEVELVAEALKGTYLSRLSPTATLPSMSCHLLGSVGQRGGTRRRGTQGHLFVSSFSYCDTPQYVCHLLESVGQRGGTRRRGAQGHLFVSSFSYCDITPQYVCHLLGSVGQRGGTRRRGAQRAPPAPGSQSSGGCRRLARVPRASVEEDEAALRRLNVGDVVQSVELVTWALDQGLPRRGLCTAAARGGHLEVLQWLRGQRLRVGPENMFEGSSRRPPRGPSVATGQRLRVE